MSGIGRLRARHGNDEGSAVIVLPILGLLACAGVAALAGIALQPDDSAAAPPPPAITAAQLGAPCVDEAGPAPANGAGENAFGEWADAMNSCVSERFTEAYGSSDIALAGGYHGVTVTRDFEGRPVVVIGWNDPAPSVVVGWAALHPSGLVTVATVRSAS